MTEPIRLGGSFRDPSGFVYFRGKEIYRQVHASAQTDLDRLGETGLYDELSKAGLLIPHKRVDMELAATSLATSVLQPEMLSTLSYPYEWSFSQLQDAALATLDIQRRALQKGMSLKDASAFNIQFRNGKPILIDTLSFEVYEEGAPWVAYRQFCRHFLAPLALMSLVDIRLSSLLQTNLDGIPLDLTSKLLPGSTKFNGGLLMHIHVHGKLETKSAVAEPQKSTAKLPKTALLGLVDGLEKAVRRLKWQPAGTVWADYYQDNNYTPTAMAEKRKIAERLLGEISPAPEKVWDFGANTGEFARIASAKGIPAVAWDFDPGAVELAYKTVREKNEKGLLPLRQDLMNPSTNLGWAERERSSLLARGPVDALFALALIHHLAIANNVPLPDIAAYFAEVANWVIVEWVPKEDSQVKRLLASREDIFDHYDQAHFEAAIGSCFEIVETCPIPESVRTLYLIRRLK